MTVRVRFMNIPEKPPLFCQLQCPAKMNQIAYFVFLKGSFFQPILALNPDLLLGLIINAWNLIIDKCLFKTGLRRNTISLRGHILYNVSFEGQPPLNFFTWIFENVIILARIPIVSWSPALFVKKCNSHSITCLYVWICNAVSCDIHLFVVS